MNHTLLVVAEMMLFFVTAIAIALPIFYQWATKGAWRTKPVGVHLMSQSVVVALLLLFTLMQGFFPPNFILVLGIFLYAALAAIKINQIKLILDSRRRRKVATGSPDPRPEDWND